MKCLEISVDGIKYFVTVEMTEVKLYVNTIRSKSIYSESGAIDVLKFDRKKAKKFINRALAK